MAGAGAGRKNRWNDLNRYIDYDVEWHEGTNMAAYPSPNGGQIVISIQGGLCFQLTVAQLQKNFRWSAA